MEFRDLIQRAMQIREQYAELETSRYGRPWTNEEIALGFVGDVGDLVQLIQTVEGVRNIPNAEEKLPHELADCLWSVIVLAEHYGIDLEKSFLQAMFEIELYIKHERE